MKKASRRGPRTEPWGTPQYRVSDQNWGLWSTASNAIAAVPNQSSLLHHQASTYYLRLWEKLFSILSPTEARVKNGSVFKQRQTAANKCTLIAHMHPLKDIFGVLNIFQYCLVLTRNLLGYSDTTWLAIALGKHCKRSKTRHKGMW